MLKRIRNNRGFSLLEVMVAAGMLGVISLGVMKVMDMQGKSAKRMDTQLSEGEIYRRVTTNLSDSDACVNTLTDIETSKSIKNKNGNVLYKVGDVLGHIKVNDISITNATGSGNKTVTINIRLERLGIKAGTRFITKAFKVDAKYENSTVKSCYLDKENLISTTLSEVRKGLEEGMMKFEKLNIQTPDGTTAIRIENNRVILKGNIQIEDEDGNQMALDKYVIAQLGKSMVTPKKEVDCEERTYYHSNIIKINKCVSDSEAGGCTTQPIETLDCSCSAVVMAGENEKIKTVTCQSTQVANQDISCVTKDNQCVAENTGTSDVQKITKQITCPAFEEKVKCVSGVWIKQ